MTASPPMEFPDRFHTDQLSQWLVRRHEGVATHPYTDTSGKITIGVGRNLSDRGLEIHEIDLLFATDCQLVEVILSAWWPQWREAPVGVQIALFSMAFNLGLPRLSSFKKMHSALTGGDFSAAAAESLDSKWAAQVGRRATDIAQLISGDLSCLSGGAGI